MVHDMVRIELSRELESTDLILFQLVRLRQSDPQ